MVDTAKIDAVLAGSEPGVGPPFTAESLGAAGADVRGLAAVEHLLFENDPTDPDTCAYAAAAAALVAEETRAARVAWTDGADGEPPFAELFANPGNDMYADAQAVLDDLVNGMAMALTEATKELADAEAAPPGERDTVGGHGGDRVRDTIWSVRRELQRLAATAATARVSVRSSSARRPTPTSACGRSSIGPPPRRDRCPTDLNDTDDRSDRRGVPPRAFARARSSAPRWRASSVSRSA